jgi:hypothetical protein
MSLFKRKPQNITSLLLSGVSEPARSTAVDLPEKIAFWFKSLLWVWGIEGRDHASCMDILLSIYQHGHFVDDQAFIELLNLVSIEIDLAGLAPVHRLKSFYETLNLRLRVPDPAQSYHLSKPSQMGYVRIALRLVLREFALCCSDEESKRYHRVTHELLQRSGMHIRDFREVVDCTALDLRIVTLAWLRERGYADRMEYFLYLLEKRMVPSRRD